MPTISDIELVEQVRNRLDTENQAHMNLVRSLHGLFFQADIAKAKREAQANIERRQREERIAAEIAVWNTDIDDLIAKVNALTPDQKARLRDDPVLVEVREALSAYAK